MTSRQAEQTAVQPPKWRVVGPGLVVAATGVGAADLVATLVAGAKFGYTLLWVAVLGAIIKVVLVEGAGRYSLATGRTIFEGWSSLGKWTTWYFGPYIVIWGFVYGAAAMAGTGLALYALFPVLGVKAWGILSGFIGLALVWTGRYGFFEKVLSIMVLLMFVSMVGAAILTVPNIPDLLAGLTPGDRVALHWDWVCDVLTDEQADRIVTHEERQLRLLAASTQSRRAADCAST